MKKILNKISFSRLLYSLIFSIALFFMSKIMWLGWVSEPNYIEMIYLKEFWVLIIIVPIMYTILYFIEKYYKNFLNIIVLKEEYKHKKEFLIVSGIFLGVIYLVYYLTFFPGGIYIDTWTSLNMLKGTAPFTSQQPVLYTLLLIIPKLCGDNLYLGFGIFTFIQTVIMLAIMIYIINWLLDKKVNPILMFFIVCFMGLFKLFPLYSVSIWKDTPFSLVLIMLFITFIDIYININEGKIEKRNIIKFVIFSILTMLFRGNGKYVILGLVLIVFLEYFKNLKKEYIVENLKRFLISALGAIIFVFIVEKIYIFCGITPAGLDDQIGIPIQQVCRVVATDGNITDEQLDLISKVMPIEKIKKQYTAMLVDSIKWDDSFNLEYLTEHKFEYLKLWIELFFQNPGEYFRAYLLITSGYWSFNVKGLEGDSNAIIWETLNDIIKNYNVIEHTIHFSFRNDLYDYGNYSGGFFFWVMSLSMFITYRLSKNKKNITVYLPGFLLWLTVMIATPMACGIRYVYILVLMMPLNFVLPAILVNIEKNNEIKRLEKSNNNERENIK